MDRRTYGHRDSQTKLAELVKINFSKNMHWSRSKAQFFEYIFLFWLVFVHIARDLVFHVCGICFTVSRWVGTFSYCFPSNGPLAGSVYKLQSLCTCVCVVGCTSLDLDTSWNILDLDRSCSSLDWYRLYTSLNLNRSCTSPEFLKAATMRPHGHTFGIHTNLLTG